MMWNKTFFGKHFKYFQLNNFSYIFCLGFPILFVLVGISNCQSVCPSPLSISPCTCTNDQIICTGISTDNDLIKVFEFLYNNYTNGQKWGYFRLENSSIEQLPNDVFKGVLFKGIIFKNNPHLTCVHPNAFGGQQSYTTYFQSSNTCFATM